MTDTQLPTDPFARMPSVPTFTLTSEDVASGERLPDAQMSAIFGVEGGQDRSPQLSWSGAPEDTKSFVVVVYDPDAPTMAGFWHWAVADLPASTTSLPAGAGDGDDSLPGEAFHVPNDARQSRFIGGAPPVGDSRHRYFFVVYALDVEQSGVEHDVTPTLLIFSTYQHVLARAVIEAWAELPD